jgi:hypothetical protein
MPFTCSICGEESTRICVRCTKDACSNHLCEKCLRCSDCCECEVALNESTAEFTPASHAVHPHPEPHPEPEPRPEPEPESPHPPPDPDPFPQEGGA